MKRGDLTFDFSVFQSLFWMNACVHFSYAATYLQHFGYSNTKIGIILAIGNVMAALLGPKLTSFITEGKASALSMYSLCLAIQVVSDIIILTVARECAAVSIAFTLLISVCFPQNSVDLELYSDAISRSIHVDYGICRGMGSLFYLLLIMTTGTLLKSMPLDILPIIGLILIAVQFITHAFYSRKLSSCGEMSCRQTGSEEYSKSLSLKQFIVKYRTFSFMLIGAALVSIGFRICSSFMINIVRNVGGDVSNFSYITAFGSLIEIPIIILYSRLSRRTGNAVLLSVAFVSFIIKQSMFALAGSMVWVYFAQVFQGPSYALECASIVPFTSDVIEEKDAANAQSLVFAKNSIGAFGAGIIGGFLFDNMSVSASIWWSVLISLAGVLIAVPCIMKLEGERRRIKELR